MDSPRRLKVQPLLLGALDVALVLVDALRLRLLVQHALYLLVLALGHALLASGFDLGLTGPGRQSWRGGCLGGLVMSGVQAMVHHFWKSLLLFVVLMTPGFRKELLIFSFFPMMDGLLVVVMLEFDFGLRFVSS